MVVLHLVWLLALLPGRALIRWLDDLGGLPPGRAFVHVFAWMCIYVGAVLIWVP